MNSKSILFLGPDSGTSRHRVRAMMRLGHQVTVVNPQAFLPSSPLIEKWLWEVGGSGFQGQVSKGVLQSIRSLSFDLALIDGGRLVGPRLVRDLKSSCAQIVNYNIDDPFGKRDRNNWKLYLRAVPEYDLVVVLRECNIREATQKGAKRVFRAFMSADEVAHAPRELTETDILRWSTDVVFVGTWMPERGPFLKRLLELGVPLSIFGNRWQKASEWSVLRSAWRGPALSRDDDYAKVIQCSKIALGLLSKGNRDQSTTRSFEIPLLGGVFCGERTEEHLKLYKENAEAVYWDSPEECARTCEDLLRNHGYRDGLGQRARQRCIANETVNEKVMDRILQMAFSGEKSELCSATAAGAELSQRAS
jgi:spore maturation protein CgeB